MRTPIAIVLLLAACPPAAAQTVDYDAFEQIFGEPVTTSATGKPQKVSDAPADMEIVTASDIEHSGADNIPDVLRFVAGIDVRQYLATRRRRRHQGQQHRAQPARARPARRPPGL